MGTRHLIAVVVDGDFKIAQYGQWDGYPSGQGVDVLNFARSLDDRSDFANNVRKLKWADTEYCDKTYADLGIDISTGWLTMDDANKHSSAHPELSRDTSAKLLNMVSRGEVEYVRDDRNFALDSLFCEYAYVLDLDESTLEVYRGFQKGAVTEGRWAGAEGTTDGYGPVAPWYTFALDSLPSDDEFLAVLSEDDDE